MTIKPAHRLAISVSAAALIAAAAWLALRRNEQKTLGKYHPGEAYQIQKFVPAGAVLKKSDAKPVEIPAAFIEATAVRTAAEWEDLLRLKTRARIGLVKGEQLTRSKLDGGAVPWMALATEPGKTAFSVQLRRADAVAGLIAPGDQVQVFCVWPKKSVAQHVLARAPVLAVGTQVLGAPPVKEKNTPSDMANEEILITLGLTPEQALRLSLASSEGRLQLALMNPAETEDTLVRPLGLEGVLNNPR